jgi:hypothetical protein
MGPESVMVVGYFACKRERNDNSIIKILFGGDSTIDVEVDYIHRDKEYVGNIYLYTYTNCKTMLLFVFVSEGFGAFLPQCMYRLSRSVEIVYLDCLIQIAGACII